MGRGICFDTGLTWVFRVVFLKFLQSITNPAVFFLIVIVMIIERLTFQDTATPIAIFAKQNLPVLRVSVTTSLRPLKRPEIRSALLPRHIACEIHEKPADMNFWNSDDQL